MLPSLASHDSANSAAGYSEDEAQKLRFEPEPIEIPDEADSPRIQDGGFVLFPAGLILTPILGHHVLHVLLVGSCP